MAYNPITDTPFSDTSLPVDELLVSDIPSTIREMKVRINEVAAGLYEELNTVGKISIWHGETPPTHYLEMNGGTTSGYTKLAALFGANLPDYRGYFLRAWAHGASNTPDTDTGRAVGSGQGWAIGRHVHNLGGTYANLSYDNVANFVQSMGESNYVYRNENAMGQTFIQETGGDDNRPTNIAVMYIVRAE